MAWQVGVLVQSLRSTSGALSGLCQVLQERLHEVRRLPTVSEREELLRMSGEFLLATTEMVEDRGVALEDLDPCALSTMPASRHDDPCAPGRDLPPPRADGRSRSPFRRGLMPAGSVDARGVVSRRVDGDPLLVPGSSSPTRVPDVDNWGVEPSPTSDAVMFH